MVNYPHSKYLNNAMKLQISNSKYLNNAMQMKEKKSRRKY